MRDAAVVMAVVTVFIVLNVIFLAKPEYFTQPEITGEAFTNIQLNNPENGATINQSNVTVDLTSLYNTNCTIDGELMNITGNKTHQQTLIDLTEGEHSYQIDCGEYNGSNESLDLNFFINLTIPSICGNEITEAEEECDDGVENGIQCNASYEQTCNYCSSECTIERVTGGSCGDDTVNGNEECESNSDCSSSEACIDCECILQETAPECGNGDVESGEDCEDDSDCSSNEECIDCECEALPECGNGDVESGEDCEDDSDCSSNEECIDCECSQIKETTQQTTPTTQSPSPVCANYWICTEWQPQECQPWDEEQTRTCINTYSTGCNVDKPIQKQPCLYIPTCDDMIRNQGEEGIDCGGPCEPCRIVNFRGTTVQKDPVAEQLNETTIEFDKRLKRTSFLLSIIPVIVVGLYFFLKYKFPQAMGYGDEDVREAKQILRKPIQDAIKEGYSKQDIIIMLEEKQWDRTIIEEAINEFYPKENKQLMNFIKGEIKKGKTKNQIKKLLINHGWKEKIVDEELKRAS